MLRTTEQRKTLCTGCSLSKTIDLVGDSQSLMIAKELLSGPRRFGELVSALKGISTRTITNKLNLMIAHGLVERSEASSDGYVVTAKGKGLGDVLIAMKAYGDKYL